jgi:NTP pyrophosphatase (non-canonical NTP hydrolase)
MALSNKEREAVAHFNHATVRKVLKDRGWESMYTASTEDGILECFDYEDSGEIFIPAVEDFDGKIHTDFVSDFAKIEDISIDRAIALLGGKTSESSQSVFDRFEAHVKGFAKSEILNAQELKANFALGLAGESGEVADLLKKDLFHGKPADLEKLKLELGDVLWYLIAICQKYEILPSDVMESNIEKLQPRHNGTAFNRARSEFGKEEEIAQ